MKDVETGPWYTHTHESTCVDIFTYLVNMRRITHKIHSCISLTTESQHFLYLKKTVTIVLRVTGIFKLRITHQFLNFRCRLLPFIT